MDRNGFAIPLNGLAPGRTGLRMQAGKEFFESFDNTEILDASLQILTEIEKSGDYIGIDCRISGEVVVECDRCLDPLPIPVDTVARLSVKFGCGNDDRDDSEDLSGREIVRLSDTDADLDLAQVIYDYVCLSLPLKRTHPEGGCNPAAMKYLGAGGVDEDRADEGKDSPFAMLGGLFGN